MDKTSEKIIRRSMSTNAVKTLDRKYNLYLEKDDNILAGSKTPIFLAKRNLHVEKDKTNSPIEYTRTQFVSLKLNKMSYFSLITGR